MEIFLLSHLSFEQKSTKVFQESAMLALRDLQNIVASCEGASASLVKAVKAESFEELKEKSWIVKESLEYWVFKKCFTLEMNRALHTIQESIKEYHRVKEGNFFYALNELVHIYIEAKKALYINESELGFSDVIALVYEILHRIDDSEFLYFRLDANIEHMLLDEFQDTSIVQYEILKPLIKEITAGSGIFDNGSFFFVGDVKQSIYRFRGGVSALFGEVAQENDTEVEKLLRNYRSQKEVVEFVNRTFEHKMKNYTPQLVKEGADGGYVEIIQNDELLDEVLLQVQRLLALGVQIDEIAILCATNGDGEEVKNHLQEEDIDVVTETTTKLINQRSVKAVLEFLKYLYFKEEIYRLNFFALIQAKETSVAFVDFNEVSLVDIVKNIIKRYKLFSDDFHLIRFLSALGKYADIESLLFEYERMDIAAAASDLSGVRVLTVHKSKGLEFEHVIVMDRLKRPPSARASIIYKYSGIALENVYLRTQKREEIDSVYATALENERILALEDEFNAFYVAFTRAKRNLFIIKKQEKSSFELLELEIGRVGVLQKEQNKTQVKQIYKPLEYQELYYGTQSDILALESEVNEDLSAINFGLALHYLLEMMEDFTQKSIPNANNMMLNKYGYSLSEEEMSDIQNRVEIFTQSDEIQELIEGLVYKEQALRYKNALRYLDLLVEKEDGSFVVIDYKSSLLYSEKHLKQVRYYVKAVSEITGSEVSGYIAYLLKDEVKVVRV